MSKDELIDALEAAIPGFEVGDKALAPESDQDGMTWLEELLGDDYCCYVEWKEFDSWGIDSMNTLAPIKAAGIELSIDGLYDDDGMPLAEDCDDPVEFFMPVLSEQLAAKNLQLLEICIIEEGAVIGGENPRLVCVTGDQQQIERLNDLLEPIGVRLS